jgi:hypothetical protein
MFAGVPQELRELSTMPEGLLSVWWPVPGLLDPLCAIAGRARENGAPCRIMRRRHGLTDVTPPPIDLLAKIRPQPI